MLETNAPSGILPDIFGKAYLSFRLIQIVGRQGIQYGLYLGELRVVNNDARRSDKGIDSHMYAKRRQRTSVVGGLWNLQAQMHEQCADMPNRC